MQKRSEPMSVRSIMLYLFAIREEEVAAIIS